jgi:hypothetical protein
MTTLKEAQEKGKIKDFIKERSKERKGTRLLLIFA